MMPLTYLLQRGTAFVMVPLVIVHLIVIIIAVQGGLSAEEILARTRGNRIWGVFYGVFVFAAAIHAGIGVQTILREWAGMSARNASLAAHLFAIVVLALGVRAVTAMVWA